MEDALTFLALALAILALAAFFWAFGWIRNRLARLFGGEAGESIGDLVAGHGQHIRELERKFQELSRQQEADRQALERELGETGAALAERLARLESVGPTALRNVHVHPYRVGTSGPESAVIVLADEGGRGVLLNVLAGKTTRVYARAVCGWRAEKLAQEEEQALAEARRKAEPAAY